MVSETKVWKTLDLGGIEDIVKSQVGTTGYNKFPFENVLLEGDWRFDKYRGTEQAVFLNDLDLFRGTSGAAHFRVANDYRVKMMVYTQNYDWFQDNVKDASLLDKMQNALGDSLIEFTLNGATDDYVSVDVDGEVSGIANFNLRINGEWAFKDSPKINDEVLLTVISVEVYEEPDTTEDERKEKAQEEFEGEKQEGKITSPFGGGGDNGGDNGGETLTQNEIILYAGIALIVVLAAAGMIKL